MQKCCSGKSFTNLIGSQSEWAQVWSSFIRSSSWMWCRNTTPVLNCPGPSCFQGYVLTSVQSYLSNCLCSASGMNILFSTFTSQEIILGGVFILSIPSHNAYRIIWHLLWCLNSAGLFFSAGVVNHLWMVVWLPPAFLILNVREMLFVNSSHMGIYSLFLSHVLQKV